MIDPEVVITQIGTLGLFKIVGGAAAFAEMQKPGAVMGDGPNAYVIPMADQAQPPKSPGGPQTAVSGVGIVLAITKRGDLHGRKSLDSLRPVRLQLAAALAKFSPGPGMWPLFWRGGHLLDFQTGSLFWVDEFATQYGFSIN